MSHTLNTTNSNNRPMVEVLDYKGKNILIWAFISFADGHHLWPTTHWTLHQTLFIW